MRNRVIDVIKRFGLEESKKHYVTNKGTKVDITFPLEALKEMNVAKIYYDFTTDSVLITIDINL